MVAIRRPRSGARGLRRGRRAGVLASLCERRSEATMCCERLAKGPLAQRDIERIAQVLLRGLERQAVPDETRLDEAARRKDVPMESADTAGE
jgi:hypothetical protein